MDDTKNIPILKRHHVNAVVVNCMDARFKGLLDSELARVFGADTYDEIKLAGASKSLASPDKEGRFETVFDDIKLAIEAHHVSAVILLNHQNCGKYAVCGINFPTGSETEEKEFHLGELRKAGQLVKEKILTKYPQVKLYLGYVYCDSPVVVKIENVSL